MIYHTLKKYNLKTIYSKKNASNVIRRLTLANLPNVKKNFEFLNFGH